jgi:hypothetical protein
MRVEKRLTAFTWINPVEIDAVVKPLTPHALHDGWMVVYIETIPFGFLL